MAPRTWLTAMALSALMAAPAIADDGQRRRPREDGSTAQPAERAPGQAAERDRAVPRTEPRDRARDQDRDRARDRDRDGDRDRNRRAEQDRREDQYRRDEQARRENAARRQYDNRGYDNNRRYDRGRYDEGRYNPRGYAPRVVRPVIVRVVPYRPYVYRPSYSTGVYYGSGGYYPYGATPRGYYDPIPGRYYGGVRITGVPRDARVFADGYYVGLVNDFDGIFQHVNLEAGPHHLVIDLGGYEAIEFDVYVRPGETTTFRGDGYFRSY